MTKILLSFFFILVQLFVFLPSPIDAQVIGQSPKPLTIQVSDINASGGQLKGSVKITNPNSSSYNMYMTTKIKGADNVQIENVNGVPLTKVTPGFLIAYQTSEVTNITAGGTKDLSFNIPYGYLINSGKYTVQFALFNSEGTLLGSSSREQELSGSGEALRLNRCFIVTGDTEYDPVTGPNVSANGEVYGKCSMTNVSGGEVTGYPIAEYAVNSVVGTTGNISEFNSNISVTIPAGTTQEVMFPLPALTTPQVYEAMAHLNDDKGNPISPKVAFRWVIAGESSNIRSITLDKGEYTKGSMAKVTIGADPSLDLFWRGGGPAKNFGVAGASASSELVQPELQGTPLTDPVIVATVKDGTGTECGSAEKKINEDPNQNIWPDQTLDVPINQDCKDVVVEAKVKNEGRELAAKQLETNPKDKGMNAASRSYNIIFVIIAVLGLGAIIAGIVIWFMKKRKQLPPPVTAALLIITVAAWMFNGGFQLIGEAHAALSASVKYDGFRAYSSSPCPGQGLPGQPREDTGDGGCIAQIISGHDMTTFNALDTSSEISMGTDGKINAHISGQFTGYGCGNTIVGLVVRAYVNNSQEGVSIDGGGPKIRFDNLGRDGGGGGTPFDRNITISSTVNKCGPLNVRIEMVPFIGHAGLVASDRREDDLIKDDAYPGWQRVEYVNRQNCGGGGDCWATIQKDIDGGPCVQCNASCTSNTDCQYAANGCTACLPAPGGAGGRTCQPPITCGHSCVSNLDCAEALNGCTSCLPNPTNPTQKTCQTQPTCGTACVTPASCEGAQNGCTACVQGADGAKCGTCPAGQVYDPTTLSCKCPIPGETMPHKVCDGDKCLDVQSCGVSTCTDDKQCFAESMCKCDGFEAVRLEYPSRNPFIFDSFAKVEGTDMSKALVEGIKFKMYESDKSNPNAATIIAESQMFAPEIVSSTASKARYKARWTLTPPEIKANKTYRVLAEIKCVPKKRSTRAELPANQYQSSVLGLVKSAAAQDGTQQTPSPSPDYLQLRTLNFLKQVQADKCYSAAFEMDESVTGGQ